EAGDSEHGATVHFVTEELDGGPAIMQSHVPVLPDDTADSLAERVRNTEHRLYPLAASLYIEGRLRLENGRALLDGSPTPASGVRLDQFEVDMRANRNACQALLTVPQTGPLADGCGTEPGQQPGPGPTFPALYRQLRGGHEEHPGQW